MIKEKKDECVIRRVKKKQCGRVGKMNKEKKKEEGEKVGDKKNIRKKEKKKDLENS